MFEHTDTGFFAMEHTEHVRCNSMYIAAAMVVQSPHMQLGTPRRATLLLWVA